MVTYLYRTIHTFCFVVWGWYDVICFGLIHGGVGLVFSWIHMRVKWSRWVWVFVFVFLVFGTIMVGVEVWIFCLVGISLSSNVLERTKCGHVIKTTRDFGLSSWFVYSIDELQVWKKKTKWFKYSKYLFVWHGRFQILTINLRMSFFFKWKGLM